MKDLILASLAAVTLAACGGSGSAVVETVEVPEVDDVADEQDNAPIEVVLAPANGNLGPNNIVFADSASGLEVFVTVDGQTKSFTGLTPILQDLDVLGDLDSGFNIVAGTDAAVLLQGLFNGGTDEPIELALAFAGSTGSATASVGTLIIVGSEINSLAEADFTTGAAFSRLTETTLPLTGSATFEGDYISVVLPNDLEAVNPNIDTLAISGDITLNADFANAVISGDITDRRFVDLLAEEENVGGGIILAEAADQIADVSLASTAIDDTGAFTGLASAGVSIVDGSEVTTEDGVFSGLIAGTDATEAVGAVSLTHTLEGQTFTELGSFIATE